MTTILIAECMQEVSSFNPLPSGYDNFAVQRGDEMLTQRGSNRAVAGALHVLEGRGDVEVRPTVSACAGSAGLLDARGWMRLSDEILAAIKNQVREVGGIFVSLHGAMAAEGELDPEGYLLEAIRAATGPEIPIVISLDLHGILTDRMLRQIDGLAVYHTYPHVDFADTGRRAAEQLLRLVDGRTRRPVITRTVIPALVRGDELITRSGCYGDLIGECRRLEREGSALAAGIMIGNPFTDVPELCSQVVVVTDDCPDIGVAEGRRLAEEFWSLRHRMQAQLVPIHRAIGQARHAEGPIVFTDAADATSSGASGDSCVLLQALQEAGYGGRVLAQAIDPAAAEAAHAKGVGGEVAVRLGGAFDKTRFQPMDVSATVALLSDGSGRLETMGAPLDAGPSAVLTFANFTVVVMSRTVSLFDRAMYYAHGLDPKDFDLIVVKSPHAEFHMYDAWVERNFNVDAPGSTSANLRTLGHTICGRPMFPLDDVTGFVPEPQSYCRR